MAPHRSELAAVTDGLRETRAPLAVSMGDPAGIGPDLLILTQLLLNKRRIAALPPFVAFADPEVLEQRARQLKIAVALNVVRTLKAGLPRDQLTVIPVHCAGRSVAGTPNAQSAGGTIAAIEDAVAAVRDGTMAGLVTLPIAKHVLHEAGFSHPGHTEFLGELAERHWHKPVTPVMMLASADLRVVPLTIHVPLADVPRLVTKERIVAVAEVMHRALISDFGIGRPRIAVAGLNPHAGENGSIGLQERDIIAPAVEVLKAKGMQVFGPVSADTLFHEAARQRYDACLAMYHDQALIPIKTLAFDRGVNVTLGLPFVRSSPDHGTAFDIAGSGEASPTSFIEALLLADRLARRRAPSASAAA